MARITIEIEGIAGVVPALAADVRRAIRASRRDIFGLVQRAYRRELRARAPVRSGRLKRSIRTRRRKGWVVSPQMRRYGYILNAGQRNSGGHGGWALDARDATIADPELRKAIAEAIVNRLRGAGT